jgi:hypothetical protein
MKPVFVISCPIDTYSGYGARSRDIVKAIIKTDKYDVKIFHNVGVLHLGVLLKIIKMNGDFYNHIFYKNLN